MKKLLILIALIPLVLACGQEPNGNLSFPADQIAWQGYLNEDPTLIDGFNYTIQCLDNWGPSNFIPPQDYPYLVVVKLDGIDCNNQFHHADGCYEVSSRIIYIIESALHSGVLSHEIVHWATGTKDEKASFLMKCSIDILW